jgi:hypothetical protein
VYKKEDAFTTIEAEDQNKIILALQGKQRKLLHSYLLDMVTFEYLRCR